MKPKTMILMGLAITCGLGASYMTSRLLADRVPAEEEKVKILVAKRNMSVGERLFKPEELFEVKEVSKDSEPPDAIKDFEALKGKIMKQSRNKGEHVMASNLRGTNEGLDIPEGFKAMGMRVNLEGSASGFATLPQSRVDIIQTFKGPDLNSSYAQILLENVLVLAADLKLSSDGELASPAQVVTFALKNEDVLRVNLAKEHGTLSLSLRKLDDRTRSETREITGKEIRTGQKEPPAVVEAPKPVEQVKPVEAPPPVIVEAPKIEEPKGVLNELLIINGAQQQRSTFRVGEDGQTIREDDGQANEPSPPRPQPRQLQVPANRKGGSQARDL